jgi:hypothetical protein
MKKKETKREREGRGKYERGDLKKLNFTYNVKKELRSRRPAVSNLLYKKNFVKITKAKG